MRRGCTWNSSRLQGGNDCERGSSLRVPPAPPKRARQPEESREETLASQHYFYFPLVFPPCSCEARRRCEAGACLRGVKTSPRNSLRLRGIQSVLETHLPPGRAIRDEDNEREKDNPPENDSPSPASRPTGLCVPSTALLPPPSPGQGITAVYVTPNNPLFQSLSFPTA